jgi:hypothetical protein
VFRGHESRPRVVVRNQGQLYWPGPISLACGALAPPPALAAAAVEAIGNPTKGLVVVARATTTLAIGHSGRARSRARTKSISAPRELGS